MKTSIRSRFWQLSKAFGVLFLLLFIFRFIYGYVVADTSRRTDYMDDFFGSLQNVRKNYASEKVRMTEIASAQPVAASNQKFEKTASIKTKSSEFEQDDQRIRKQTQAYHAVIQYEQNLGQKGNRQLHLMIGVTPNLFETFSQEIQKIGIVKDIEITKVDKTNEYKQLNAQKVSIEKTLQSLNDLKSRGGQIADYIALNDKILEMEEKLQNLGVELGNFDAENEFCTIKLSLYEGQTEKNISVMQRIKVSLEWTIKYFAVIVFTLLGMSATIFLFLLIIDKLKVLKTLINTLNN